MSIEKVVCMSKMSSLTDDFRPIMPPLIRLLAGIIVLMVVQSVILGFPGISNYVPNTAITIASTVIFLLGLFVSVVVLKFGTQLAGAVGDGYRSLKNYVPLIAYFFQMTALIILYKVGQGVSSGFFTSVPWAYPLMFLLIALVPTIKMVVNTLNLLEGRTTTKHLLTN